ncbi:S-adenosyl-L-methionine-dependent methyltransferase [Teratosphaeria nubilosa]|uniref:S-adenosyl-L-methionine-dependent methyltransferase n=1 Tax=Teratosphaeria nubilosa TaxID=161662 RepID=A0A6G1L309_9PEZI|nr:S-adenosyl-L-methionine-dependent methyltransferase [Teratosphaeria nubilosa]
MTSETAATAQDYEEQHVHNIYEQIASHFSSTRYKPWPIIEHFLKTLPPGSIGLDIGCGNGKYLPINKDIFIIGSDHSTNLTTIAKQHHPHAVCVADILALPHQDAKFDFAISIAVIHHLSTPARRIEAVRTILATLKPKGGKALLYVWALEQEGSRRGWKEGGEQDVMVPWVTRVSKKAQAEALAQGQQQNGEQTFHRYYHLYRRGELTADVEAAGGKVLESGYEKDNWWVVATTD